MPDEMGSDQDATGDDAETKPTGYDTWRDWLPPGWRTHHPDPPILTRAELLAELNQRGVTVTERRLRFWEAAGVLPRPMRSMHLGKPQATYPDWHVDVVESLVRMRQRPPTQLEPLADMRPYMRSLFRSHAFASGEAYKVEWSKKDMPQPSRELVEAVFAYLNSLRDVLTDQGEQWPNDQIPRSELRIFDRRGNEVGSITFILS